MKRITSVLALLLTLALAASGIEFEVDGLRYTVYDPDNSSSAWFKSVGNDTLTKLVIPDEVTYQGKTYPVCYVACYAVRDCPALEEMIVGRNVIYVDREAFTGISLKKLVWYPKSVKQHSWELYDLESSPAAPKAAHSIDEYLADYLTLGSLDVSQLREVVIEDGVIETPEEFLTSAPITSLHLPASVELVRPNGFIGCSQLETITVDPANPTLDSREGCNAVVSTADNTLMLACRSTRIPRSVTAIGQLAHQPCADAKSLTIPSWIEKIGSSAFDVCQNATELHSHITDPRRVVLEDTALRENLDDYLFGGLPFDCKLYVPAGTAGLYREAEQWKDFIIVEETLYDGPEDVNGDGRLDIDDLNAVVNAMLNQ